ncbi:MAG: hypothetical protein MJY71_07820 [Bacteroidaceae bacterium]|nr:hypothetical protein [Bacteroidaceae bacterium]
MNQNSEGHIQIQEFESRITQFAEKYKALKATCDALKADIQEKDRMYLDLQQQFANLQQKYNYLKNAQVLTASGTDIDAAKRQIVGLIREIDQCIKLINA